MSDNLQTLPFDNQLYALADLPQVASDALISPQFVEERLQQLRNETTVSQTLHLAYASWFKAELAQTRQTVSLTTPSL